MMAELLAAPLRFLLIDWWAKTGDPPERIAVGFDLPLELVTGLLSGYAGHISLVDAALVCRQLRVDPTWLWPETPTALIAAEIHLEEADDEHACIPWPSPFLEMPCLAR